MDDEIRIKHFRSTLFYATLGSIFSNLKSLFYIVLIDVLFVFLLLASSSLFSVAGQSVQSVSHAWLLLIAYVLSLVLVYTLCKFFVMTILFGKQNKAKNKLKHLLKFYSLNIALTFIFLVVFWILNFIVIGIRDSLIVVVSFIVVVLFFLFLYVVVMSAHCFFFSTQSVRKSMKRGFSYSAHISSYFPIVLVFVIFFGIVFGVFFVVGTYLKSTVFRGSIENPAVLIGYMNTYNSVFFISFFICFYLVILFNRFYLLTLLHKKKLLS